MNDNFLVSVIIPTINSSKKLEECLESIKKQSYNLIEVIVVIPKEDAEFNLLSKKYNFNLIYCDQGKNASRNKGAENSHGDYLLHIDDDMRLSKDVILECIDLASKENYKAVVIPETEERLRSFYNKIRILEKFVASYDIYIVSPRFVKKDIFNQFGKIDVRLDPIDEGDMKIKLVEMGISYGTTKAIIYISSENRQSSLISRWSHMYDRGKKMPLFNFLHPTSNQLRPFKRIDPYIQKFKIIFKRPAVGLSLIFIKMVDLVFLYIGALNISNEDKKIIARLKNISIFENEAGTYQKDFFENTLGARYVDKKEKGIVEKYLKDVDKNSYINILDIGPGGGRWSELMLDYFPNSEVFACDLSKGMIKDLEQKFRDEPRLHVAVGDMQNLPYEDSFFDLIISIRAIKYATDQKKVFQEISRVLKFGGKSIVELPYFNFIYRLIKKIKLFGKLSEYANRINLLSKSEITKMLRASNFLINNFEVEFSIPATFYKKIKNRFVLKLINIINYLLPKSILGRSNFISLTSDGSNVFNGNIIGTISIILVNYNGKKWLNKCLDSLYNQTYKDFEIIFVDNNSEDDSIKFVEENYPAIRIIKSDKNLGFAGGNNLGINNSKGDYILLLNSDTWLDGNFLEKIKDEFEINDLNVLSPVEVDYNGQYLNNSIFRTIDIFGHTYFNNNNKKSFYLQGICLFFKKSFYLSTCGLDNNFFMYSEETDWFWRLNLLNKKFGVVKNIYVNHSGAGSSGQGIKYLVFLWRNQNTLQMLFKNYKFYNLLWILPIYFIQNIIEILFFLLIFKPKISLSYIQGWWFNIKNIKKIFKKRKWVQENRLKSDLQIMRKMYIGSGKLVHLIGYFSKNNKII
ncbi:MAG: glycosyltransferase [Patescibacteria group bacterium]|jgi:hypothetical protein